VTAPYLPAIQLGGTDGIRARKGQPVALVEATETVDESATAIAGNLFLDKRS
jgi:hypothetical protein